MSYQEELKRFKKKRLINNLIAFVWLFVIVFGVAYMFLNVNPTEYYSRADRLAQMR